MRRDTFLVFPPSHFNPETNSVELTKQPTMASFIWKDVHFPTLPFHAFQIITTVLRTQSNTTPM